MSEKVNQENQAENDNQQDKALKAQLLSDTDKDNEQQGKLNAAKGSYWQKLRELKKVRNIRAAAYTVTILAVAIAGAFTADQMGLFAGQGLSAQQKKALVLKELEKEKNNQDLIRTAVGEDGRATETVQTGASGTDKDSVQEQSLQQAPSTAKTAKIVEFGMDNVRAVSDENGQVMLMGENGRFVVSGGRLYDLWAKKEMKSIDDIEYAAKHIPVKGFGFKTQGYNVTSVGHGKENVYAFVDPFCGWCHRLMTEIQADQTLTDRYTVHFYVVPALGDASNTVSRQFFCAKADNKTKFEALKNGAKAIEALPESNSPCDTAGYDQTLMMAQLLGVKGVPFIVAADGRFIEGKPKDVRGFLMPKH